MCGLSGMVVLQRIWLPAKSALPYPYCLLLGVFWGGVFWGLRAPGWVVHTLLRGGACLGLIGARVGGASLGALAHL